MIFLPAFVLDYQYGEMFDPHGNRKPHHFQAFINGVSAAQVAAERHFSPIKVHFSSRQWQPFASPLSRRREIPFSRAEEIAGISEKFLQLDSWWTRI